MHHRKTDREFCIYVCGNIDFIRRYTQTFYADVYRCNREHRRLYAFSVKPSSRYKAPSRRSLGWEAAAHPDTTLAVAEAATSPCADLHAASGQCSCPHMRAAFKLLAVQTQPRRAWASGGCANDRRGHARDIQRAQCAYACGNPPTAPAPAIEAPLAAPRASPSSASHGANTGTVAARNAGAQQRRRTRTRTACFRPPSALRGAIVRRQAGISACTRVCMYTGGAAAGHASATHAGRAQQDAARAPTRRVRSRAPVPSHGVARGRGRC